MNPGLQPLPALPACSQADPRQPARGGSSWPGTLPPGGCFPECPGCPHTSSPSLPRPPPALQSHKLPLPLGAPVRCLEALPHTCPGLCLLFWKVSCPDPRGWCPQGSPGQIAALIYKRRGVSSRPLQASVSLLSKGDRRGSGLQKEPEEPPTVQTHDVRGSVHQKRASSRLRACE